MSDKLTDCELIEDAVLKLASISLKGVAHALPRVDENGFTYAVWMDGQGRIWDIRVKTCPQK